MSLDDSDKKLWSSLFSDPNPPIEGKWADNSQYRFVKYDSELYWGPNTKPTRYNDKQIAGKPYGNCVRIMHITYKELWQMYRVHPAFVRTNKMKQHVQNERYRQAKIDADAERKEEDVETYFKVQTEALKMKKDSQFHLQRLQTVLVKETITQLGLDNPKTPHSTIRKNIQIKDGSHHESFTWTGFSKKPGRWDSKVRSRRGQSSKKRPEKYYKYLANCEQDWLNHDIDYKRSCGCNYRYICVWCCYDDEYQSEYQEDMMLVG